MEITRQFLNNLTYNIIGAAIEVHKTLGPGLLESIYHRCVERELGIRDIEFKSEMIISIKYKGVEIGANLRCDLLIENLICIEIKAVEKLLPVHEAQLLFYMKLLKVPKGILINFNVFNLFKDGQKTFVNNHFSLLKD